MSVPNQISFAGKTEYTVGDEPTGMITYMLDPDTTGGMPITSDVYQKGVVAYLEQASDTSEDLAAVYFSKQLLLFLLSFDECTGITFSRYLKPDGTQSLAALAVDENKMSLGWNPLTKGFTDGKFVAAEWAHTSTQATAKKFLKASLPAGFDFERFFKSL
ncbi:hypothetical protein [Ferruginibacter albus]|uniref:hypothetical protein n=1 Tax=Ferruginibacter albus TaxID=2875540 RepID=UPI001CC5497E|nr:hypothetical protein [Ferruginibacter albus]UAY51548.1 hypothetical protein K9M53_13245 [Ferruginibacter albus]